jgi:hypothetical protein
MNWQGIRELHPHAWVVVEALDGRTEGEKRVIDKLSVCAVHGENWKGAWEEYKLLHHADKRRELYVLHTDRVELDIGVLNLYGRQVAE